MKLNQQSEKTFANYRVGGMKTICASNTAIFRSVFLTLGFANSINTDRLSPVSMAHRPKAARHSAVTISRSRSGSHRATILKTSARPQHHITITTTRPSTISSSVPATAAIQFITTVAARCRLRTVVCRKAYRLPSKRPR
jgi:hypothetical protein